MKMFPYFSAGVWLCYFPAAASFYRKTLTVFADVVAVGSRDKHRGLGGHRQESRATSVETTESSAENNNVFLFVLGALA